MERPQARTSMQTLLVDKPNRLYPHLIRGMTEHSLFGGFRLQNKWKANWRAYDHPELYIKPTDQRVPENEYNFISVVNAIDKRKEYNPPLFVAALLFFAFKRAKLRVKSQAEVRDSSSGSSHSRSPHAPSSSSQSSTSNTRWDVAVRLAYDEMKNPDPAFDATLIIIEAGDDQTVSPERSWVQLATHMAITRENRLAAGNLNDSIYGLLHTRGEFTFLELTTDGTVFKTSHNEYQWDELQAHLIFYFLVDVLTKALNQVQYSDPEDSESKQLSRCVRRVQLYDLEDSCPKKDEDDE